MEDVPLHSMAVSTRWRTILAIGLACGISAATVALEERVREVPDRSRSLPALSEAMQSVARAPHHAPAQAALANALFRNGDFEGAERAAREALLIDPEEADALVVLARCLQTSGRFAAAAEHLKQAADAAPRHPVALRLLAGCMDLNTNRGKAVALTQRFVELNPPEQKLFVDHARQMLKLIKALGSLALSEQPPWDNRPAQLEIPMRLTGQGLFIELMAGDMKQRFLLDTGEESITVRSETAKALGLKSLASLPAVTASGVGQMPIALAPKIQVGGFHVKNVLVSMGAVDVVGPAFFAGYIASLDFQNRRLVLKRQAREASPGPKDLIAAPKGFKRFRFRRLGNLIWVPISSPGEPTALSNRPAWGVFDTGCQYPAAVTLRYLEALRSEPGKGPLALPFRAEVGGAAGGTGRSVVFYALKDFDLVFLGARLSADGSAATKSFGEISKTTEAAMDLMIGWPLIHRAFKSVEIDYQRCILTVQPRTVPLPPSVGAP